MRSRNNRGPLPDQGRVWHPYREISAGTAQAATRSERLRRVVLEMSDCEVEAAPRPHPTPVPTTATAADKKTPWDWWLADAENRQARSVRLPSAKSALPIDESARRSA